MRAPYNKHLTKNKNGFTIIEVMIVRAVASLIMLIVFLAVPALQRNSRNTQRRSDASHLAGLVNEYAANHAGTLPTVIGSGGMDLTNEQFTIMSAPVTADIISGIGTTGTTTTMKINTAATCNPTTGMVSAGSSTRQFAISFQVETGGAAQASCISG